MKDRTQLNLRKEQLHFAEEDAADMKKDIIKATLLRHNASLKTTSKEKLYKSGLFRKMVKYSRGMKISVYLTN